MRLTRWARQELQLAGILGPLSLCNLRCPVSCSLFSTDASPFAGAIVQTTVAPATAAEIYRRGDFKGFHTALLSPQSANLRCLGLDDDDEFF